MSRANWVYILDENEKIWVTDKQCHFLESEITNADTQATEQEMAGRDGVLVGPNTFGPFELKLNFYFSGTDKEDLMAFTEKIKRIIHVRQPRYVVHSDLPGRKYAFNTAQIEWETITSADANFSITFKCYKGYSESLTDTLSKIYRNST